MDLMGPLPTRKEHDDMVDHFPSECSDCDKDAHEQHDLSLCECNVCNCPGLIPDGEGEDCGCGLISIRSLPDFFDI